MIFFVIVAYYLNLQFQYDHELGNCTDLLSSMRLVIKKLEPNVDIQIRAMNEIKYFRNQIFGFGDPQAIRGRALMTPSKDFNIIYSSS